MLHKHAVDIVSSAAMQTILPVKNLESAHNVPSFVWPNYPCEYQWSDL